MGRSLLHHGAQSGSSDVLSYLVLQRQDENELLQDKYDIKKYINKPNSGSGRMTPLHYAAKVSLSAIFNLCIIIGRTSNDDQIIIEIWCRYQCKR